MAGSIHVLLFGSGAFAYRDGAITALERLATVAPYLPALGVEVRAWDAVTLNALPGEEGSPRQAIERGRARLARSDIDWADVVVFRRAYLEGWACDSCGEGFGDRVSAAAHGATGHPVREGSFFTLPAIVAAMTGAHDRFLRGRAVVYDTDEDLLCDAPGRRWAGALRRERATLESIVGMADLAIAATPAQAQSLARWNAETRVIRQAVDSRWLRAPDRVAPGDALLAGAPLAGVISDGSLADEALPVDAIRAALPTAALGALAWLRPDGAAPPPFGTGVPVAGDPESLVAALAASGLDLALAPIPANGTPRAGTELSWLLYTAAGIPTVAGAGHDGPYDRLRHRKDALLARSSGEWREHVARLAGSPALRDELVGNSRERIMREHDARTAAERWAEALCWAAEHPGRGRTAGPRKLPVPDMEALRAEGRKYLDHRRRVRDATAAAPDIIERLRAGREVCYGEEATHDPLVSVVIPTYSRGRVLVDRSLASVLNGTYRNIEVIVCGDHATPETLEAIASVDDPRVRFVDLPVRTPRPADPYKAWLTVGSRPFNTALSLARGQWIAPQADDDEFTPDHIETLLSVAIENRLEFVYGQSWMELADGTWRRLGDWPPHEGGFCAGAVLFAEPLRFITYDEECWRDDEPNDWGLWRRIMEAGVRMGSVEQIVFRHYLEARWRFGDDAGGLHL